MVYGKSFVYLCIRKSDMKRNNFLTNTVFTVAHVAKMVELNNGNPIAVEFKSDYSGDGFDLVIDSASNEITEKLNDMVEVFESSLLSTDEFDFTIYDSASNDRLKRVTMIKLSLDKHITDVI